MDNSFRILNQLDNEKLIQLSRLRTTGADQFSVDRSPDFFSFCKTIGDTTDYIGGFDLNGNLILCVGITLQKRFLFGKITSIGYLHDLRTAPGCSYSFIKKSLSFCTDHFKGKCEIFFANVLSENDFKNGFLKKRYLPPPFSKLICEFKMSHCLLNSNTSPNSKAYAVKTVEKEYFWQFYLNYKNETQILEKAVLDNNNIVNCFMVFQNSESVAAFCLLNQDNSRQLNVNKQHFKHNYLSLLVGKIERHEIISIAQNHLSPLADRPIFYSGFTNNDLAFGTCVLNSSVFVWSDKIEKLNTNYFLMDLNEI